MLDRVASCEEWVRTIGFKVVHIKPDMQFEELMKRKKGFPNQRFQWCSSLLKGLPFLTWIDEADIDCKATVIIGKRREESKERASTPEFIDSSIYHGGRRVWHPLYQHSTEDRNALLLRAGFTPLPHRSQECAPCVNANRSDFRLLTEADIKRVATIEEVVGKTMFRSKRHAGAKGIYQVVEWANADRGKYDPRQDNLFNACSSGYCGF